MAEAGARQLESYRAQRLAAQSRLIDASMLLRRYGAAPSDCDSDYEVLDR